MMRDDNNDGNAAGGAGRADRSAGADVGVLEKRGFARIGEWRRDVRRGVVPDGDIPRSPGVFAFVAAGRIGFLGKAANPRAKMRNYAEPASRPAAERRPECTFHRVGGEIAGALDSGARVEIYFLHEDRFDGTSLAFSNELRRQVAPLWSPRR